MNTSKEFGKTFVKINNYNLEGEAELKVCNDRGYKYWILSNLNFQKRIPKDKNLAITITTPFDGQFEAEAEYSEQNKRILKYVILRRKKAIRPMDSALEVLKNLLVHLTI